MTKAEHAWLLDMAPRFRSWDDLLASFECAFGYQPKRQTAQSYTSKHGVKLMSTTVRWLEHPEYDEFLREFVPGHSQGEIIDEFEKRFDVRLRVTQLKDREATLGLKQGTFGGRFAPGTVPPNKGKKLTDYVKDEAKLANIRRCQFKKGEEVHNECPIGTERVSRDGYIEVKVPKEDADDRAHGWWKPKHRLIWEQVNGRKLQKGESVMFGDRDMTNFDPENLVMVTQAQRLFINRHNIPYHDAESLRTAVSMAKLNEAIVTAELRPRKCPCCGKTYKPQYKAQRTCRECLESGRKAKRSYSFAVCAKCGATFEKLSPRGKYCPKCRKRKYRKEKG